MSRRSWKVARRYVLWPLGAGAAMLLSGRRLGWAMVCAAAAVLWFFRDPEREPQSEPGAVYSAADGVVTEVDEVDEPWLGGRAARVSTFLSLHNVHVNRSPVAGRAAQMERAGGGYAPALFGGSEGNYSNRVAVDGERGRVVVVQKAGMIARRVTPWIEVGEELGAGQRIGIIHFGSRVDVLLPAGEAKVLVRPGARVRAGLTRIAHYREVP